MIGRLTLHDYQRTAVEETLAALDRRPILVAPTGSGKTVMAVDPVERLGVPTLWLAHRKELIDQAHQRLAAHGLMTGVVMAGYPASPLARVQVASIQTLVRREKPPAELIVIDECFPTGTLVDGLPIERISVGDVVRCHNHATGRDELQPVARVFRRQPRALVRVVLSDGHSVVCTPGHPFFTERGYVRAADLHHEDCVQRTKQHGWPNPETMRRLRRSLSTEVVELQDDADLLGEMQAGSQGEQTQTRSHELRRMRHHRCVSRPARTPAGPERTRVLQRAVQMHVPVEGSVANHGRYQPEVRLRAHEGSQSDAQCVCPGKGVAQVEVHRPPTTDPGRQWPRPHRTATAPVRGAGMAHRGADSDRQAAQLGIPDLLQNRHCQQGSENSGRGGRAKPPSSETASSGSQTGRLSRWVGVDRIEVLEPGGDGRFGGLCPDGHVYNLEVTRHHNYYANDLLVHNCHHTRAQSYRSVLDAYPEASVVGLTATPFRLDGRGLGDLFGEIVVAAHTDDLCESGVLHSPKVWASSSPDVRGVKVVAGDYALNALSLRANRPELNADIVNEWHRLAAGKRTVVFAVDVAHSQAIVAAFRDAGVPAEHLDGSTPRDERDAILARLASGETLIVSNCMVLTEGWDLPVLECVIIARPTASLCLHLQMLGRVMRAAVGKVGAIVLDHAGNHHVHGLVTRRLRYALDGTVRVGESDPLGMRRCQACGLFYESKLTSCPDCGHAADRYARDAVPLTGKAQLAAFDDASFAYRQQVWRLIEAERQAMGFKPGWSWYRYKERFDAEPVLVEIDGQDELIDPTHATREEKAAVYERLLRTAMDRRFAQGWASHRYREMFGCWPMGFVSRVRMEAFARQLAQAQS